MRRLSLAVVVVTSLGVLALDGCVVDGGGDGLNPQPDDPYFGSGSGADGAGGLTLGGEPPDGEGEPTPGMATGTTTGTVTGTTTGTTTGTSTGSAAGAQGGGGATSGGAPSGGAPSGGGGVPGAQAGAPSSAGAANAGAAGAPG